MARSNLATSPVRETNRAPDIPTAASDCHPPKLVATSSCHRGVKSSSHPNSLGRLETSPHSETNSFWLSSSPSGTTSSNKFGSDANNEFIFDSISASDSSTPAAVSPTVVASALIPTISSVSSPLLSLINMPTLALNSLRCCNASSRCLINETRSKLRVVIVLAASRASSDARRERRCERTRSRFSDRVRASRLDGTGAREIRLLMSVSLSAAAAVEKCFSRDAFCGALTWLSDRMENADALRTAANNMAMQDL
mmetsp:Transcript_2823/g.5105  ORF Transcript_2823/g.5105 Transcript_2823/m.5105 type:complete len:254 (+) Transcript_2823:1955-2716(+)